MFMECLFEAKAPITDDLKRLISKRQWSISISNGKAAYEFSHQKYFIDKIFEAELQLYQVRVFKKNLTQDEKNFLINCSINVRYVYFYHPLKIDGRSPKNKIEWVVIKINETFVSKKEFKGFLPWVCLAESMRLELHDDTNFIDDICDWVRGLNFKKCRIMYRGKTFYSIEELDSTVLDPK